MKKRDKIFAKLSPEDLATFTERVQRGALLLDEKIPGWYAKINLDRLDLENTENCVLGQVFDEPVTMPQWQLSGFDSAEALLKDPDWEGVSMEEACEEQCTSNVALGIHVLWNVDVEDLDYDDGGEHATTMHGFDNVTGPGYPGIDYLYAWDVMDFLWMDEVVSRQEAVVKVEESREHVSA